MFPEAPPTTAARCRGNEAGHRAPRYGGGGTEVSPTASFAAGQGRGGRAARKKAAPEEERPPGSGGVKDTVRDELAESQESR